MKKPEDGCDGEEYREQPSSKPFSEAEPFAKIGMLDCHTHTLQDEIGGGKPVASASRVRNYEIVDQPGGKKYRKTGNSGAANS